MSTEVPAGFVNAGKQPPWQPPPRPDRPNPVASLRWAVRIGVLLVLLTPLIVRTELYFPFVVGKALYARAVIEIVFALWIALVLRDDEQKPPVSWVLLAFGAWVLASLGSGLIGVSPTRSLWSTYERMQGVFDLAHWLAFAIVAAAVFRRPQEWRLLLTVNVVVSALVCGLGVAQHFALVDHDWLLGSSRLGSSLGNPNYVGGYAMVNALISLGLVVESLGPSRPRMRWLGGPWIVAFVLNVWAMWLSGTRSAVVGMVAAGVALAIVCLRWGTVYKARIAARAVLGAFAVAAGLLAVARTTTVLDVPDPAVESGTMLGRLASVGPDDPSIRSRILAIETGLRAFPDRPVFGWGPENYLVASGRHLDAARGIGERYDHAHNKLVEELTTKGLVGLLAYLALWSAMAGVMLRSFRRNSGCAQLFIGTMGATLVAYFVHNMFLFDTPATMMQFSLLVAFVMSEESRQRFPRQTWLHGPSRVRARLRASRRRLSSAASSSGVALAGTVAVAALTTASLSLCIAPAWRAAAATAEGMGANLAWPDRIERFQRAIAEFPGLANHTRMQLIDQSSRELARAPSGGFERIVKRVTAVGARGLEVEPENWMLEFHLARFFQIAATRDVACLEPARRHAARLRELAPRTWEAADVLAEQERLEKLLGSRGGRPARQPRLSICFAMV